MFNLNTVVRSLFIRACFREDADKHIRRVYRRFYLKGLERAEEDAHIVSILASICDDFFPFTTLELLYKIEKFMNLGRVGYKEAVLTAMISKIRTQPYKTLDKVPGLVIKRR